MKVLIISHLPAATQSSMGKTILSLFSSFAPSELCQMYIYPAFPNINCCASFYRVTDKDVLASIPFGEPGGEVAPEKVQESAELYENPEDEAFYRNRKNRSSLRRLMRDAIWRISRWDGPKLEQWIRQERPECLFVVPGVAKFVYDFGLRISRKYSIPMIGYICDEYYFVNRRKGLLDKLQLGLLKAKIRRFMSGCAHLVVICEELRELYSREFEVGATTLMTGASGEIAEIARVSDNPTTISYFGNIRCNRYLSLAEIGRELDRINRERGTEYALKIYTSEKDPEILEVFSSIQSVELCGFLTGKAFEEVFLRAEFLLHVEAFDEESIDFVKHSISTKIADSLASGIPLLAYGPTEVASMGHLLRGQCAIAATSLEELGPMLTRAFSDREARESAVQNALAVARNHHDSAVTSPELRKVFVGVIGKKITEDKEL